MKGAEPHSDQHSLLADLKSGGESAFNYFYEKYSLQLYRKLLKMVQADVIAEELLQDLFMKIWEKREYIDPDQSFKSYLYRIAERIVYDYFRELARKAKASDYITANSTEIYEQFENGELEAEMRKKVQNAIARLPEQQRIVFNLCKIEGKSYEEVSTLLGITTGTINTHITRATKTIKTYLTETDNLALIVSVGLLISELK
jgi:RNA polymerase sigma-70 factor (family 1)